MSRGAPHSGRGYSGGGSIGHRTPKKLRARVEALVSKHTAAPTFGELIGPVGHPWRPTLRAADGPELADLYDAAQAARGDARRAYRGESPPNCPREQAARVVQPLSMPQVAILVTASSLDDGARCRRQRVASARNLAERGLGRYHDIPVGGRFIINDAGRAALVAYAEQVGAGATELQARTAAARAGGAPHRVHAGDGPPGEDRLTEERERAREKVIRSERARARRLTAKRNRGQG